MSDSLLPLLLLLIGFLCQWLAWRVQLPAILFLLIAGIVLGPATGVLNPDALLGEFLFPLVSLGVAIILFEGSLTLRFSELKGVAPAVINLVSVGALITLGVLAAAAHYLVGLSWELSLLFGALTCVTGPTVVTPMLRSVRPNARIANVLRWEGIVIDPIGALFAVLVFNWIVLGLSGDTFTEALAQFGLTTAIGTAFGLGGGIALGALLHRHWIPEYLQNYAALVAVLGVFTLSNAASHESGLLAVTLMGMWLGNQSQLHMDDILDFKEHLSTLLISLLFILLAARLEWPSVDLAMAGLLMLAVATFIARPLSVLVSTLGSSLTWPERGLIAWIAPRGIVAAAVSALFALKLEDSGLAGADLLVPLTFMLIIGTVVLQSATSRRLALRLGVSQPSNRGVLIVGASRVARELGKALQAQKIDVLLADDDWMAIRAARMDGLPTYFGNPVSEHADVHLDLTGIGSLIAASTRREINTLACVRFEPMFGRERIYRVRILGPGEAPKQAISGTMRGRVLFGEQVTQRSVEERIDAGGKLRTTKLTDAFSWKDYRKMHGDSGLLLFAIDDRNTVRLAAADSDLTPKAGWTAVVLSDPKAPSASAITEAVQTEAIDAVVEASAASAAQKT